MYRLKTANGTMYADTIRYIRLHDNGCYVECHRSEAEGICAKVHETLEEVGATLLDTVFVLAECAMHGTEPLCASIESVVADDLLEGQEALEILRILGGEIV